MEAPGNSSQNKARNSTPKDDAEDQGSAPRCRQPSGWPNKRGVQKGREMDRGMVSSKAKARCHEDVILWYKTKELCRQGQIRSAGTVGTGVHIGRGVRCIGGENQSATLDGRAVQGSLVVAIQETALLVRMFDKRQSNKQRGLSETPQYQTS